MTALDRARGWFIAPPESTGDEPGWCADPAPETGRVFRSFRLAEAEEHTSRPSSPADDAASPRAATASALAPAPAPEPRHHGWRPPTARGDDAPDADRGHPGLPTTRTPPAHPSATDARDADRGHAGLPTTRTPRAHPSAADAPDADGGHAGLPTSRTPRAHPSATDAPDADRGHAGLPTTRTPRAHPSAADAPDADRGHAGLPTTRTPRAHPSAADAPDADRGHAGLPTTRTPPAHPSATDARNGDRHPPDLPSAHADSCTPDEDAAPSNPAALREVTSAAVLGRAGEVEPVAAALALALRRETHAATATVAVVGAELPELTEGGGAARKLGARLDAHGFEARVRGRLAWVRLDPADGQLAATARRLTLVGAPAVLAVSAPRNEDTDRALLDCDLLVIVAGDPDGPLASLAAAGLADVPVTTVRPLGRGPARALARAGIRTTPAIRRLLTTEPEPQP